MAENKKQEIVSSDENIKKALELHDKKASAIKQAKKATIKSRLGKTKTITVAEDSEHPYEVTLRFPGTMIASQIEDRATGANNNILWTNLMNDAIDQVIVSPKIKDLSFFDEHDGYSEVAYQVLQFLNELLN